MKSVKLLSFLLFSCLLFMSEMTMAQTTVQIGSGSSSSSTRGPFQRADTNSTTVFSRWVQVFTASELAAAGVTSGVAISELKWELASSNVIIGSGDANLKIYVKNSSATAAMSDTWANHTAGSTLAYDQNFNTTNNFPGANGWMGFVFTTPFVYTGGALEVAVDWDCSTVSTPAFSGNGAIKWRWHSTSPDQLVVKKTSSSAPSTNITDLKDERANIQIVYSMASSCTAPTNLNASNLTATSADFNWAASAGATSYNWKVVGPGAGASATAIASGNSTTATATATGLAALTAYDLHVEADCGGGSTSGYSSAYGFSTVGATNTAITIGTGTSSSSTRGPFQRSDTNSSTVYSRFVHVYTSAELGAAGIMNGDVITSLNWELASSNTIIGSGDARLKVYVKNSSATTAVSDTWTNHTTGSSLVVDNAYNTTNNFPGMNGWMAFNFNQPFTYTGGALEIAVDWDCSQVSTPAFSGDGSLKWRWESTAPDDLVVKKTSSSSPSSNITDLKDERANIQIVTSSATATTVDLTLSVDMSQYSTSFTQVYISGNFNGWSGTSNPLTDQGNGVWSGIITVPMSDSIEYKFTHDDWAGQEQFAGGEPCTITDPSGQFINRLVVSGNMNTTVPTVCWNSCTACGTAPAMVDVTFKVDMSLVDTVNPGGVFLGGNFESWNGGVALSDADNDNVWEAVVSLEENKPYEFKFINGPNWADGGESFDPTTIDSVCTLTTGTFTNRIFSTASMDTTTIAYCYSHCFDCATVPTEMVNLTAAFDMMPNPANDYVQLVFSDEFIAVDKTIAVHNAMGQVVFNTIVSNTKNHELNTSTLANGMYYITVRTTEGIQTKRLVVSH